MPSRSNEKNRSALKGRFRGIVYITGGKQPTLQGGREFGCAYMHKKKPNSFKSPA